MYEVTAHAVKVGKTIEVTVSGFLSDSCRQAAIVDVYPGGKIAYVRDPGVAQVFIEEVAKPSRFFCTMMLVPWAATTHIYDEEHQEVEILINKKEVLQIPVIQKGMEFIVVQLTGGILPAYSCSILPAGTTFLSIYSQVFGPSTYSECMEWVHSNCKHSLLTSPSLGDGEAGGGSLASTEGGGSGTPRGLLL